MTKPWRLTWRGRWARTRYWYRTHLWNTPSVGDFRLLWDETRQESRIHTRFADGWVCQDDPGYRKKLDAYTAEWWAAQRTR